MKHFLKLMRLVALTMILTLLPVCGVFAASAPSTGAELAIVKGSVKNKSVQLQWTSVSDATGYNLYQVDSDTNKLMKTYKTTKRSYTVKKLTRGKNYSFYVKAYNSAAKAPMRPMYSM